MINVCHRRQKSTPLDYDGVKNRLQNMTYSDKSTYEEWVATILTDYIGIIEKRTKKGAKKNGERLLRIF